MGNTEQVNQTEEVTEVEKYDDEDIVNYFLTKKDDIVTSEKSSAIKKAYVKYAEASLSLSCTFNIEKRVAPPTPMAVIITTLT